MRLFKKKFRQVEIDLDEIFMDSHNIPQFDTQQFEGRIETSISKKSIVVLGTFFIAILLIFCW